jgi:hypothetical protein
LREEEKGIEVFVLGLGRKDDGQNGQNRHPTVFLLKQLKQLNVTKELERDFKDRYLHIPISSFAIIFNNLIWANTNL